MASFLFTDKPANQTSENKTPEAAFAIRTMRDDLESIKNGEPEYLQSQSSPSQPQFSNETFQNSISSSPITTKVSSVATNPPLEEKSKEEERVLQNPFGVAPDNTPEQPRSYPSSASYRTTQGSTPSPQPITEKGLVSPSFEGSILVNQQSKGRTKLLITLVVILFLFAASGIWYFLLGGKEQFYNTKEKILKFLFLSDVNVVEQIDNLPEMSEENETPKSELYSSDKPNYLPFNTETVSPEDIRATFSQIAARVKEANITEPIEFLVTDQNNNPLAFNRFAFLLKLDLDPEILSLAEESFSLYAYNDVGAVRFGLVLDFNDAQIETIADIIKKTESELPHALQALIIEPDVIIGKEMAFQSTNHNQFSIRFTNIDIDRKIAIDYTLYNNRLFVGTSRKTLRAMLDSIIDPALREGPDQAEKK